MLARVCFALDPSAPVRLRGFRAMLDGIGTMLACRFTEEQVRTNFMTFTRQRFVDFCLSMNSRLRADIYRLAGTYERLAALVMRDDIGFGIERALYALNPTAPCRSPMFERDYVAELPQLLPALERLAQAKGRSIETLIDRHIAAFIAAQLKAPIAAELREMRDAKDHFAFSLPAARILALVQVQGPSEPVPALCGVIATMLEPALERFHNRNTRDQIRAQIQDIAQNGDLGALVAAIDNREALAADDQMFRLAAGMYAETVRDRDRLEYERKNRTSIARVISSQVASLLSGVIATVAVLVTILVKLL